MNNHLLTIYSWTQHWFNSRSLQNAPQETEIESYVIGGVKQDVKKINLKLSNYNGLKTKTITKYK
ncbi:MAG: hypothetical protein CM15mV18_0190 [uncultured marine virus]|nr:MAG: hypothetical protein CM15mV18_0190 [uncultured marine virus]